MSDATTQISSNPERRNGAPSTLRADLVRRRDTIERIKAELGRKKLVLIAAPAGYGKTTSLHFAWHEFDDSDCVRIWLSLTAADANPKRFAAALSAASAEASEEIVEASTAHSAKHLETTASESIAYLAERLDAGSKDVLVFIDEYHGVQSAEVDVLVSNLMQRTRSNVRFIMASRVVPSCGVAKMRLEGEIAEFSQYDLSFTDVDTDKLFEGRLSPADIRALTAMTEGWPAALRMSKLWLADLGYPDEPMRYMTGAMQNVFAYFAEEIFIKLSDELQTILCETSVLAAFDAEIVNEVLLRTDATELLLRLDELNAFIILVDPRRQRYRHHPLFADFLRQRLISRNTSSQIAELHRRAAAYYQQRGDYLNALDHAVEVGNRTLVSSILGDPDAGLCGITVDFNSFRHIMDRLERNFPDEMIRLLPSQAFYYIKCGRLAEAHAALNKAQKLFKSTNLALNDEARDKTYADLVLINAVYEIYVDNPNCEAIIDNLQTASAATYRGDTMYQGIINNLLAVLLIRRGRLKEAERRFMQATPHFSHAESHFSLIHNYVHRGMLNVLKADSAVAEECFVRANDAQKKYLPCHGQLAALIEIGQAVFLYESGDLANADVLISRALPIVVADGDYWVELLSQGYRVAAKIKYARNGFEDASHVLDVGLRVADQRDYARLRRGLWAQQIHLAAIAGETEAAERILSETGLSVDEGALCEDLKYGWCEEGYVAIALIRLQICQERIGEAFDGIDKLKRHFAKTGLNWFSLKCMALEALALHVSRKPREAADALRHLAIAGDEAGVRSFFLEEGPLAQQLLEKAGGRFGRSSHADQIKQTIVDWLVALGEFQPVSTPVVTPTLTEKQAEILRRASTGVKRHEIAAAIGTTPANVQYHLKCMFKIFDVANTVQLIAKAQTLGLVDERVAVSGARQVETRLEKIGASQPAAQE